MGEVFLDWVAPLPGLRWLDVGCGSGAFTGLLMRRCAPAETRGVDPSEAQLKFARARPDAQGAKFEQADAMALPFPDDRFDAAVMALVIFFVPDPAKGVAEMVRVVRPGGIVCAYAWDMPGGGFPFEPVQAELRALGVLPSLPPNPDVSRMEALTDVWTSAGIDTVETREITVRREFPDFDDFWAKTTGLGSIRSAMTAMTPEELARFKDRVRERLPPDDQGRIIYGSRANAITGRVAAR